MDLWIPTIRKFFVIGIWILVGIQVCPATQSRDRNPFLWYFIGLISFYIPFAVVGFVPPVLILMLMKRGMEIPASFFDLLGVASFLLAVILGLAYLDHVKAFVLSAPRSSRS